MLAGSASDRMGALAGRLTTPPMGNCQGARLGPTWAPLGPSRWDGTAAPPDPQRPATRRVLGFTFLPTPPTLLTPPQIAGSSSVTSTASATYNNLFRSGEMALKVTPQNAEISANVSLASVRYGDKDKFP